MSTLPALTDELPGRIRGRMLWATEPGFDEACLAWNRSFVHRPDVVVVPDDAADVAAAVRYAAANGMGVTVQATGHGVVRAAERSMLILTHNLNGVHVDPETATARIGSGAKWERVLGPAQAAGLAPLLGSTPDVSAVGYTLGGGMGWLARKYGLSIDRVRSFEIVTADGTIRRVSEDVEPDLFWALRGAGAGSLGVITEMEIELVPVTRMYAGNLFYPMDLVADVAAHYRRWLESVPDELTSSLAMMNFPPFDEVPEFLRGQSFVIVRGCFAGSDDEGEALLAHWRQWRPPLFDLWGPMPFTDVAMISNDPVDPMAGISTTDWLADLDDAVIEVLARRVYPTDGPPMLVFAEIRHAGGAIADGTAGAYGHRDQRHLLQMVGISEDEPGFVRLERYAAEVRRELEPYTTGYAYLNFLEGDEKRARARTAFDEVAWRQLAAVKAAVDPGNLFDHGLPLG